MKSKKEPDSSESALLLLRLSESPPHDVSRASRKVSFRTSAGPRRGRQATSVRALATKFNALSESHPAAAPTAKTTLGRRASREEPRRRAVAVAGNVKAAIRIFEQGGGDATPPAKRASELPHANAPGAKHYCVVSNGADDEFRPCTPQLQQEQGKTKTVLQGGETYVRTVRRDVKLAVAEVDAQILEEEEEEDEYEAIQVPSMLPNSSFLWRSAKTPPTTASAPDDYDDVQPYESEDTLYDDVGQAESDGYEYCDDGAEYDDCNIYDDVRTDAQQQDLYEPIYGAAHAPPAPSCSSNSSCDQSNSLYGVASTGYAEGHSSSGSVQQVPRSETSDEWVDLEQSDVEQIQKRQDSLNNKHILQERARSRTSSAWSYKVRKQRRKSQREESQSSSDNENSSDSDTDHHYEMLEDVVNPNNTCADNSPFDDFDSFDSDDSVEAFGNPEKEICNGRLPAPPPPQNIYGITKIAEVAGRKMLKLRKSFGRMRTSKRHLHLTASPTASQGIKPSPPLPPPPLEKANSAGTIATPNRYFSLRKFKKSVSSPTQISSKETSTFYLSNDSSSEHNSSFRNADDDLIVTSSSTQTLVSENSTSPSLNLSNGDRNRKTTPDRRASAPARPNSPPPLPPTDASKKLNKKEKKNSSTSWYAECGLFDRRVSLNFEASKKATNKEITPNCWYAEVGLWDGRSSPNESSLSEQDNSQVTDASEYSTSQENSGILTYFKDEPLYQFYNATVVELAQKEMQGELDSDGYEEIGADGMLKLKSRPTAMELIQPRDGLQRTLWCEIPEVVNSRVLSTLNIHQKKLQEAKFEIITSEASYVNSLNVLQNHFISSPEFCDMSILSKNDKRILFGNVLPVKICSEKFLAELEECWQDNILLHGICDVIYKHATQNFNVYIKYCSNQIYLDRTLRRLRDQYDTFSEVLQRLESSPECQALSLHSFLMLPMQRITRLPLLVDAMLSRLHPEDDEYKICELALAALNKVVQDCNEGARRMERMEEILILSRQLEFPKEIKPIPIISSTRWLVRCGEVTQLLCRGEDVRLTFGKRFSKMTLHLYLFTDLLVITKKKSDECFIVLDYCPRNLVQMASADSVPHLPVRAASDGGKNLIMLTMLQNHENKTTEMFLSCSLESDRQRWLEAVMPPSSDNPEESVYEQWDCPQVQTLHPYSGQQPDELSLAMSDVVNVLRKVPDGWYYGERIRDGEKGWFPGNHTVEIASAHVRAKNLKQRYRLLTLSGTFLESQRKQGK